MNRRERRPRWCRRTIAVIKSSSLADEKQAVDQPPEGTPDKNVGDFDGAFFLRCGED
ncbi:hypothetical protein ACLB1Q_14810 [Escherichia coli]